MGAMSGLPRLSRPDSSFYKSCQFGKQTRNHFKTKYFSSSRALEIIHIDICDPTREKIPRGGRYFMLLIDDFTMDTWIVLLKEKSEAFKHSKKIKSQVENEKYLKIKCLRSNKGGEYTSREFE